MKRQCDLRFVLTADEMRSAVLMWLGEHRSVEVPPNFEEASIGFDSNCLTITWTVIQEIK